MIDENGIRAQFPILNQHVNGKKLVYLDNAASSQIPRCVMDTFINHYENDHSNIHRGIHSLAERSTLRYEEARAKVARFIGARSEEIVFTHGATESGNLVAYSFLPTLQPGDVIVATEMDHHSNFVEWQQLAKRHHLVFKTIPVTSDFRLDLDEADKLIGERTRIVTVPHVSNVLGTINSIKEIASMAHRKGALLYVDGAQAVGHIPLNVKDIGADFYGFSGHKMYAPTGIGVLYITSEVIRKVQPFHFGGGMIDHVTLQDTKFAPSPTMLEAGTPNIVGAICLGSAVDFISRIGSSEIQRHEADLTRRLISQIRDIKGISIIGPLANDRTGVVSVVVEGMHAHDVSAALDEMGIAIRAGHHCAQPLAQRFGIPATARASMAVYNIFEDIDTFVSAIVRMAREIAEGMTDRSRICMGSLTVEEEACRQRIIDHHLIPRNKRDVLAPTSCTNGVNPSCGDSLKVCLVVNDDIVTDIAYNGYGCAISEAAMSILTEELKGRSVREVEAMTQEDMLSILGIPVGILKMKCAMLGLRTTQASIKETRMDDARKTRSNEGSMTIANVSGICCPGKWRKI